MKLQKHVSEEAKIPDLENKISNMEILRRLMSETKAILIGEIGQRELQLRPGVRDLNMSFQHLEIAIAYLLQTDDKSRLDPMVETVTDTKRTDKLIKRTSNR